MSIIILYGIPILGIFMGYLSNANMSTYMLHSSALLGLLGTVGISEGIKYGIIGNTNPRPHGARNCNLWCNDGEQEGRPGMPSSHAALVAFFVGFYYPYLTNTYVAIALILYGLLVLVSRYMKHCHSIEQLLVGTVLGIVLSILVHRIGTVMRLF